MSLLVKCLNAAQARHSHLCPRQVLGVRMALLGLALLGLPAGEQRRDLVVIAEMDGCFVDGLEVTALVSVGHRSLHIEDYGKLAATFARRKSTQAVRLRPRADLRAAALAYAPDEPRPYFAQLRAYQLMPDEALLDAQWVALDAALQARLDAPRSRVDCACCGEEINNGREQTVDGQAVCAACAGEAYYREKAQEKTATDDTDFQEIMLKTNHQHNHR